MLTEENRGTPDLAPFETSDSTVLSILGFNQKLGVPEFLPPVSSNAALLDC
jgi:hypothetical protein